MSSVIVPPSPSKRQAHRPAPRVASGFPFFQSRRRATPTAGGAAAAAPRWWMDFGVGSRGGGGSSSASASSASASSSTRSTTAMTVTKNDSTMDETKERTSRSNDSSTEKNDATSNAGSSDETATDAAATTTSNASAAAATNVETTSMEVVTMDFKKKSDDQSDDSAEIGSTANAVKGSDDVASNATTSNASVAAASLLVETRATELDSTDPANKQESEDNDSNAAAAKVVSHVVSSNDLLKEKTTTHDGGESGTTSTAAVTNSTQNNALDHTKEERCRKEAPVNGSKATANDDAAAASKDQTKKATTTPKKADSLASPATDAADSAKKTTSPNRTDSIAQHKKRSRDEESEENGSTAGTATSDTPVPHNNKLKENTNTRDGKSGAASATTKNSAAASAATTAGSTNATTTAKTKSIDLSTISSTSSSAAKPVAVSTTEKSSSADEEEAPPVKRLRRSTRDRERSSSLSTSFKHSRIGDTYQAAELPPASKQFGIKHVLLQDNKDDNNNSSTRSENRGGEVLWDPDQAQAALDAFEDADVLDDFVCKAKELSVRAMLMESLHKSGYNPEIAMREFKRTVAASKKNDNKDGSKAKSSPDDLTVHVSDMERLELAEMFEEQTMTEKDFPAIVKKTGYSVQKVLVQYYQWKGERRKDYERCKGRRKESDYCAVCDDGGTLILCDLCKKGFHLKCLDPPLTKMPQEPEWYCTQCLLHSPARIRHGHGRTPNHQKNVARQQDAKNQGSVCLPKSLFNSGKIEKVTNASNINRPKPSLASLPALMRVDEGRVQQKGKNTGTSSQPIAVADSDEDSHKGNKASSNKRKSRQAAKLPPAKVTKQTNGSRSQQQKSKNQQGRKVEKAASRSKKGTKSSTALGEATRQNASGEKAKKQRGKQSKKNASEGDNENDLYTVIVPVTSEGLLIKIAHVRIGVIFTGYRRFANGRIGPVEAAQLFHERGDLIVAVDGQSILNLPWAEAQKILTKHGGRKERIFVVKKDAGKDYFNSREHA